MPRVALVLALALAACGPSVSPPAGPDARPEITDNDGDGYAYPEDCNDSVPTIHPGVPDDCDGIDNDCSGWPDDAFDADRDRHSTCAGDCNDANPTIYYGAPEQANGVDDDCDDIVDNHRPDYDDDGDGFTEAEGDCNDEEAAIGPASVEVQAKEDGTAEGVDNDCDGLVDEAVAICDDGALGGDAAAHAQAMELCDWVSAATFNASSAASQRRIAADFGSYTPHRGTRMSVLSTGVAADRNDTGYTGPQSGSNYGQTCPHPDPQGDPADGCGSADPAGVHDMVELTLEIDVPPNALSFSFDFNFMTAEYPEWVCSEFDDTFIAYLESSAFTGNVSFDAMSRPVTVNIGFFTVCASGASCTGDGELTASGFEGGTGGGTGWLTTTAPVTGGEHIRLRFLIFDEGDGILDSTVLLDNFRWKAEAVEAPITVEKPAP